MKNASSVSNNFNNETSTTWDSGTQRQGELFGYFLVILFTIMLMAKIFQDIKTNKNKLQIENNPSTKSMAKQHGTKWMTFWVYIWLPLITVCFACMQTHAIIKFGISYRAFIYTSAVVVFLTCLICGLHKKYVFAWWLNLFWIVGLAVIMGYQKLFDIANQEIIPKITTLCVITSWILCNIVYWWKRKYLFFHMNSSKFQKILLFIIGLSLIFIVYYNLKVLMKGTCY